MGYYFLEGMMANNTLSFYLKENIADPANGCREGGIMVSYPRKQEPKLGPGKQKP